MTDPQSSAEVATPAALAHDLNNLLTVLSGSLSLAERHAVDNPALGRLLANMRLATDRAEVISRRLAEL